MWKGEEREGKGLREEGKETRERDKVPYQHFFFHFQPCLQPALSDRHNGICMCEPLAHSRTRGLSVANHSHYATDCRIRKHSGKTAECTPRCRQSHRCGHLVR